MRHRDRVQLIGLGRQLRMVRIRRGWRQQDVASRCGVSPSVVARHERGMLSSVGLLERHAAALELRIDLRLVGRSGQLVRLGDEEHAAIVEAVSAMMRTAGFDVRTEVSFNEWGERGRIDLLGHEERTGTVVLVEAKALVLDLQDLFGALDVKTRLLATIARRVGWPCRRSVVLLAVAATAANRAVVAAHPSLFAAFAVRRFGSPALAPGRGLVWVTPRRTDRSSWLASRQRVRRPHGG